MNAPIQPEPAIIVIFGITGDLVKRKLFPALFNLIQAGLLHEQTVILGVTRQNINADELLSRLTDGNQTYDDKATELIKQKLMVQTMDVTDGTEYDKLLTKLNDIEQTRGVCMNRLYYLSIPPQVFGPIVRFMGEHGLNKSCEHNIAETRLLVEKPFGYDYKSAAELINDTSKYFREDQIFRIDHYLAKETVQNIISFRFNNAIFESQWDSNNISRIDIVAFERIGIEGRSVFYEQTGALRDLIQSHLLQLMSIVMMEEPDSFNSSDIHSAKLALLDSIGPINGDDIKKLTVRGQYKSYKAEVKNPGSNVETYAAIRLEADTQRWRGVPIVIKTGKKLSEKKTEVTVVFKRLDANKINHNSLTFRIQPNEGIGLELFVKKPGLGDELATVDMDFSYDRFFDIKLQTDAYERVLVDVVRGDRALFTTSKEVLAAWKIVDPILEAWSRNGEGLEIYDDNSTGPKPVPDWLRPDYKLSR